jgi:hypothetical protein
VAAEHHYDGALLPHGGGDRVDNAPEVARHQYIRKSRKERRKTAVRTSRGRESELSGGYLVGPPLDWNGADTGQVCFRSWCGADNSLGFFPRPTRTRAGAGAAFTA